MPISFSEYQKLAMRTRSKEYHPGDKTSFMVTALGLCGEAGEFAEIVKKHVAHKHGLDADAVRKELGDILWYVAHACECFGYPMEEIAQANIDKLKARYPDGFSSERSINRDDGIHRA